jgi:hypothetical protein
LFVWLLRAFFDSDSLPASLFKLLFAEVGVTAWHSDFCLQSIVRQSLLSSSNSSLLSSSLSEEPTSTEVGCQLGCKFVAATKRNCSLI